MPDSKPPTPSPDARRRVRAVVALRLLEVIREQDLPPDVMEEENTALTLPRRLGLSDVVERQIRAYRSDVRRGVRLTDEEVRDLFRLVIRRPDSEEVFLEVGRVLAGEPEEGGVGRFVPSMLCYAVARWQTKRGLKRLFGRPLGGFGRGPFCIEGRSLPFIQADPGGEACNLMSGYCQAVLTGVSGRTARVAHTLCQARGDDLCRWEGSVTGGAPASAAGDDARVPSAPY